VGVVLFFEMLFVWYFYVSLFQEYFVHDTKFSAKCKLGVEQGGHMQLVVLILLARSKGI